MGGDAPEVAGDAPEMGGDAPEVAGDAPEMAGDAAASPPEFSWPLAAFAEARPFIVELVLSSAEEELN